MDDDLRERTFNNVDDINGAIDLLGLTAEIKEQLKVLSPTLGRLAARRHKIVHESDREDGGDTDHGKPRVIRKADVEGWFSTLKDFFALLFANIAV